MRNLRVFLMGATLLPIPVLVMGLLFGGGWAVVALFYMTAFAFLTDEAVRITDAAAPRVTEIETWLGDKVPVLQGLSHLALLPVAIFTLADNTAFHLLEKGLIFAAFGLYFGQFSTSNAHELIHRTNRLHHHMGKWVFISLLFGHHVTAHLTIHHRFVATDRDPNSARLNESFHRFFRRAWRGSFVAGLQVENARLGNKGRLQFYLNHPYAIYILGALTLFSLVFVVAGLAGVFIYLSFAFFAQLQLLLSDYVQHYGLRRQIQTSGVVEPVSLRHSWNAPHWFSAAMMMNAPRHSDHHAHPNKPYPSLTGYTGQEAPQLPHSIPVMSCLAMVPPLWRRLMNPRVAFWQDPVQ